MSTPRQMILDPIQTLLLEALNHLEGLCAADPHSPARKRAKKSTKQIEWFFSDYQQNKEINLKKLFEWLDRETESMLLEQELLDSLQKKYYLVFEMVKEIIRVHGHYVERDRPDRTPP